jgi:ATP-binding cassette subfamily B protein
VRRIIARFWPETRPLRGRLYLSAALVVAAPVLSTAAIWLFKIMIDRVVVPHDFRLFPELAAAYFGIAVLQGVVAFSDQYVSTWVSERFVLALRAKLFRHLHRLSLGFFDARPLGDLLSRLTGDINAIEDLLITGAGQALTYLLQLLLYSGALFLLDWRLAAASLAAAPGFLLAARYFSKRIKIASREKRRRTGALTAVAEESFSNAALVRAYDHAEQESARFHEQTQAAFTAQMTATRLQALFAPLTDLLEVLGVLLVLGLAVYELASGRITIGGLLTFMAYLTQLYSPLQGLGQLTNQVHAASAGAERVIELLDEKPTVLDPPTPRPLSRAVGAVSLRGVGFGYPGGCTTSAASAPSVSGIDLDIEPGQKVAVVGASGAGKSTIAKLLLRFYDPDTGAITLDGIDLRELAMSDLYRNVAVVLQETLVFDGTIRENIRWGRPDAVEGDVIAAAISADAHEFITALPEGYDTRVGQRGRKLSGGQRQRVAIARAMIRDAPVLLLDEPTTGLDADSTARVLAPLRRLMTGRTTIIISHNLLTVTDADRIVYLEQGRIAGIGTHAQLVETNRGYAQLYRHSQEVPEVEQPTDAIVAPDAAVSSPQPKIQVSWVRYQYPGRHDDALAEVSFTVPEGGCVAVVGPDGSGKSTLLRLLRGQLEPTSGEILFDGKDTWRIDPALRHRIALAPKDGVLLDAGVARNIARDRPNATPADVVAAAEASGAAVFIDVLPRRYATRLGASGYRLNDGQRRRILIARALLTRPDVLLLDEPTAGLQPADRHEMLGELCRLATEYTLVLATQDPLVTALADYLVRLEPCRAANDYSV